MSLQIWLPLNGTLKNNGLGTISATSGTLAFKSGGKIANTSYDLSKRYYIDCPELANLQTFSICFWGYVESSSTITSAWQDLIGFNDVNTSGTTGIFRWETYYTNGGGTLAGIHWHDNATNALVNGSVNHNTAKDEWCHCCVVFDNEAGKIYSYSNGKLIATHNHLGGHFNSAGQFYLGENNNIAGKIQDVRFYDHALSPKEVKEISKGLCLHYRLSEPCENLLSNSRTFDGWSYSNGLDKNYTFNGAYSVSTTIAWMGININLKFLAETGAIKKDDVLTYSVWVSSKYDINNAHFTLYRSNGGTGTDLDGNSARQIVSLKAGKWIKMQQTFKVTDYSLTSTDMRYEYDAPTEKTEINNYSIPNNGIVYFALPKLEKSSKATSWMPSKNDTLYSTLGYGTTEYDCSGFGNNGTKVGVIVGNIDTSRYDTCYNFSNSAYINAGQGAKITDEITVSIWGKSSGWRNIISCTEVGGWNFENNNGKINFPVYVAGVGYKNCFSIQDFATLSDNKWHHLVGTYNGFESKLYVDGKLCNTTSNGQSTKTPIGYNNGNAIFIGAEAAADAITPYGAYFTGNISDCRIYATALSADDITELYKTSCIVDNNKNIYAYELKEEE